MLECKSGDAVVQLRRLLLAPTDSPQAAAVRRASPEAGAPLASGPVAGYKPVVLDEIWLPGQLFKGLTAERLTDYKGPMYGMFEAEFGVRMIRAEEKIRAVAASADEAALL